MVLDNIVLIRTTLKKLKAIELKVYLAALFSMERDFIIMPTPKPWAEPVKPQKEKNKS